MARGESQRIFLCSQEGIINYLVSLPVYYGSPDKTGGQLRLAWKAIHIGFADVGNRGQA